jgi:hypothetical protein
MRGDTGCQDDMAPVAIVIITMVALVLVLELVPVLGRHHHHRRPRLLPPASPLERVFPWAHRWEPEDREGTAAWQAFFDDLLGDLLPVRLRTGTFGCSMLTHRVVELMGMQAYFMAMLDAPDAVHRLMRFPHR